MRLPFVTLEVFVAIARHGSLRAAADALGLKPSTISHQLKSLEDDLDTALFIRTTRALSLTEAGRALLQGAGPAFDQLTLALEAARTTGQSARGTLKLAMPDFVYQLLISPALKSFSVAYPDIKLDLSVTDAFSDILGEELHAGFRLGDRIAPDMVAVRLTPPLKLAVLGSPDYFDRYGMPSTPTDLLTHNCIRYRFQTSGKIYPWLFVGGEGEYTVQVDGRFTVNTLPSVIDLAVNGLGLAYTFRDYAVAELASAALISILEGQSVTVPGLHIYFPREYRTMVPLRLFLDHLKGRLAVESPPFPS